MIQSSIFTFKWLPNDQCQVQDILKFIPSTLTFIQKLPNLVGILFTFCQDKPFSYYNYLGHTSVKRWTRKVDIFGYDLLVIPVHLKVHWCLATVDLRVTEKWHWLKFKIPIIKIHYRKRKSLTMIP